MTNTDALRIFAAARGDPVLAAWAYVLYEHNIPHACDVSPFDHLEAFQDLFSFGLVTGEVYDRTDIKQVFFSGNRPESGEVQDVLANMEMTCIDHQEELVSNAKLPTSAFSTSLTKTGGNGRSIERSRPAPGLGPSRPSGEIAAFRPQRETLPANKEPAPVAAFGPPGRERALPTKPTVDARTYRGDLEINCQLICCGHPLNLVDEGGDIVPADCVPHEEFSLIEYMFHAECDYCGAMYHTSVGKPIPRDSY